MVALIPTFLRPLAEQLLQGQNPLTQAVLHKDGIPVAPGHFPVLGSLPSMFIDSLAACREAERRVGPLFWVSGGFGLNSVYYTRPDALSIFKNKSTTSEYLLDIERVRELFGSSVITRDGAAHHHMRSAMNGPFLPRGLGEAGVGAVSAGVIEERVRGLRGKRGVRALAEMREMALDVIFRIIDIKDRDLSEWRTHYERLGLLMLNIPIDAPGSPRRVGRAARVWLDAKLLKVIQDARAREGGAGLLSALVNAKDEEGHALSDEELIDNLRVLLLAGHETSASTMAWLTATLAQRPDAWAKLRDEALAAPDLPRSPKDLRSFPYAEALFRETLRMYPPVVVDARRAIQDFDLAGYTIRKGTMLSIPILHLSRSPELYEAPDEFRPERWVGRAEGVTPLELIQFGGGPHFCLGYHLAWMEIVQFAVALGRMLPASGPRLDGPPPKPVYLPLLHPSAKTRLRFD